MVTGVCKGYSGVGISFGIYTNNIRCVWEYEDTHEKKAS